MKKLTSIFVCLSVIAPAAPSQTSEQPRAKTSPIANGVYSVLAEHVRAQEIRTDKVPHAVLVYDGKYSDADRNQPPKFVGLDLSSFVPLILAGNP